MELQLRAKCSKCERAYTVDFTLTPDEVKCLSCNTNIPLNEIHSHIQREHTECPKCKPSSGSGLIIGGAVVGAISLTVAAPALIAAAGFGSLGIVGGSAAAAVQSAVYGGATTGVFSTLTSIGMAGMGAGSTAFAATAGAAGGAALGAALNGGEGDGGVGGGDVGGNGWL